MDVIVNDVVSVVIPVFNRPTMLREAVASVLSQTWRPIEIIIVDDGSTDETPSVAAALAVAHPEIIRVLRQENAGPGCARETGRLAAHGEFIQYLDSDDLLLPDKFAVQVAALRARPDCGIAYGITDLVDDQCNILDSPYKRTGEGHEFLLPLLLVERWWNTHTPLYRMALCEQVGPWSRLRTAEDWEYDARTAATGCRLAYAGGPFSQTRMHSGLRLTGKSLAGSDIHNNTVLIESLYKAACDTGVSLNSLEGYHFCRWAFSLSRAAAKFNMHVEADKCLKLATRVEDKIEVKQYDLVLYRMASAVLGYSVVGKFVCIIDKLRN